MLMLANIALVLMLPLLLLLSMPGLRLPECGGGIALAYGSPLLPMWLELDCNDMPPNMSDMPFVAACDGAPKGLGDEPRGAGC